MNGATKKVALGSAVVLMFGFAACGADDDDASGDEGGGASTSVVLTDGDDASGDRGGGASLSVVLTDGRLELDPTSADAGSVEIVARNEGGDGHNLVIVKGEDPAALPVDGVGAVIEDDLPEGDVIGKIAVIESGTEESASFDLDSGSYILFCNTVSGRFAHFQDMVTALTVT